MMVMLDWLVAEYGTHLTDWERSKISDAQFALICLLLEGRGEPILPIYVNADDAQEDELGCRDGIDAIILGTGEGLRKDYEVGLWALERLCLAKQDRHKNWGLTQAGRDASVALSHYECLLKEDVRPRFTVLQGALVHRKGIPI